MLTRKSRFAFIDNTHREGMRSRRGRRGRQNWSTHDQPVAPVVPLQKMLSCRAATQVSRCWTWNTKPESSSRVRDVKGAM